MVIASTIRDAFGTKNLILKCGLYPLCPSEANSVVVLWRLSEISVLYKVIKILVRDRLEHSFNTAHTKIELFFKYLKQLTLIILKANTEWLEARSRTH